GIVVYIAASYDEVPGADEKVGDIVKDYAEKAGVSEREPYINTDKGDILLFLFLFSGLASGFYLGYNWRKMVCEKAAVDTVDG
ncbi:MAG: hypothetical protein K6U74_06270, partial [Firmicutes bacterium]|nr:hypothetical protein [Bacillota bacterium]